MASNSKVAKSAKLITVQKWETELNCKLEYCIINGKVEKQVCSTCKRWEKRQVVVATSELHGYDQVRQMLKRTVENVEKANNTKEQPANYESRDQTALFTDYIGGEMNSLAESVANTRYFACLIDGSTDKLVTEQDVVYVLFLSGVPVIKYVSIESVENANAEGVQKSIEDAFGGFVKK